ncbi:N-lysine methyltransferase KMT5A-like [Menidia menidia]
MASRRRTPEVDALEHAGKGTDKTSKLDVKYINTFKGRGVFATATFLKGEFVVEYRGDLIDSKEEERRRKLYHAKSVVFMFGFRWREKTWCIDASREDGSFGRLVNDDHLHPNCKMKKMISEGKPHLFLFALRDILPGEEITYNYGGSDWPWRKKAGEPTPSVTALSDADVSRNTDQDSQSSEATLNQAGEPTPSVTALSDADVSRNTDQDSQSSEATLNQLDTSSGQKSELMETLISYEDIESDKGDE